MKKIPTLYKREFKNHKITKTFNKITEGCEKALEEGIPTWKFDGFCCAVINGELYKRYDAKKGKKAPKGAIPCCDPDPITGHHPHWLKCDSNNPADKWFFEAYKNTKLINNIDGNLSDGTYEAIGLHFNGNPYHLTIDALLAHSIPIEEPLERTYEGIKNFLENHPNHEGLVFWIDDEPICKIKRTDFGFEWNTKKGEKC